MSVGVALVLGILIGAVGTLLLGWIISVVQAPKLPPCPACLRSGETCAKEQGHEGPHLAFIALGSYGYGGYQRYAWEDPSCGLHSGGFFHT
jgi:hypothetical protein